MSHPLQLVFEKKLKKIFDKVDDYLEDKYGSEYPLHPNRAPRGITSNKSQDGLFNIGASFSAGYGTQYGRGYVIDIHMSTLATVHEEREDEIKNDAAGYIQQLLNNEFPGRDFEVRRDGNLFKIVGDFTLGKI